MFPRERLRYERRNLDHFFLGNSHPPPMPMPSPLSRQRRGLLQKILGHKEQVPSHPFQLFPPPTNESRGILQTLSNPDKINQFLANTQKVLDTAQQIKPVVEQYGPMIKNLPMLWKLYKGFRNLPSESEEAEEVEAMMEMGEIEEDNFEEKEETKPRKRKTNKMGSSVPKLYI